eukprot:TRINITY_DN11391_c0_g2_i1.p2 TRINITY_DN11391_c0_g2~~TRINITY_DN11391_c0_g2_i1.p2  ORF type:complete len:129 (-),score=12.62 TRINITY_DN11391_c0_g2_i1:32-418(-)
MKATGTFASPVVFAIATSTRRSQRVLPASFARAMLQPHPQSQPIQQSVQPQSQQGPKEFLPIDRAIEQCLRRRLFTESTSTIDFRIRCCTWTLGPCMKATEVMVAASRARNPHVRIEVLPRGAIVHSE